MTVNQLIEQLSKLPPEVRELQVWATGSTMPIAEVSIEEDCFDDHLWVCLSQAPYELPGDAPSYQAAPWMTHTLTAACPACKKGVIVMNKDKTEAKCYACGISTP